MARSPATGSTATPASSLSSPESPESRLIVGGCDAASVCRDRLSARAQAAVVIAELRDPRGEVGGPRQLSSYFAVHRRDRRNNRGRHRRRVDAVAGTPVYLAARRDWRFRRRGQAPQPLGGRRALG